MDRNPSAATLAAFALTAGLLIACSDSESESANVSRELDHPLARVGASTSAAAPSAPGALEGGAVLAESPIAEALSEAADLFAHALRTHDLTGLALSFSPGGLAQAQALTARIGSQRGDGVTDAQVSTVRELGPDGRWEVYLDVDGRLGKVQLRTTWEWFHAAGWRIVAIELLAPAGTIG